MNALASSDFDKICRCCLSSLGWKEMISLDSWHLEIYFAITLLEFIDKDTLSNPKLICSQCVEKMKTIKDFAELCKESHKKLTAFEHEAEDTIKIEEYQVKSENVCASEEQNLTEDSLTENNEKIGDNTCNDELILDVIDTENDYITITNDDGEPIRILNCFKKKSTSLLPKVNKVKVRRAKSEILSCDKCNKTFRDAAKLENHKRLHLKKEEKLKNIPMRQRQRSSVKNNTCYTCKTKFETSALRNNHYKDSATCQPKQYVCEFCNKSFNENNKLIKHRNLHSENRQYSCEICSKTFKHESNLKWHKKMHNKEEHLKHMCTFCGKGFALPCLLKLHEEKHTKSGKKTTKKIPPQNCLCSQCGKILSSKNNLAIHVRSHIREKLTSKDSLKNLEQTNPYKCPHCPKSLSTHQGLKEHLKLHLGIRPYVCKLCGKTFTQSPHLKYHMGMHSGVKSHKCHICNKQFVSAANLKLHILIHTGDKPLKCSHCEEAFSDYKTRRVHIQKIHGVSRSKEKFVKVNS